MSDIFLKSNIMRRFFADLKWYLKSVENGEPSTQRETAIYKMLEESPGLKKAIDDAVLKTAEYYADVGRHEDAPNFWSLLSAVSMDVYGYSKVSKQMEPTKENLYDHPLLRTANEWKDVPDELIDSYTNVLRESFGPGYESAVTRTVYTLCQLSELMREDSVDIRLKYAGRVDK